MVVAEFGLPARGEIASGSSDTLFNRALDEHAVKAKSVKHKAKSFQCCKIASIRESKREQSTSQFIVQRLSKVGFDSISKPRLLRRDPSLRSGPLLAMTFSSSPLSMDF